MEGRSAPGALEPGLGGEEGGGVCGRLSEVLRAGWKVA